MINCTYKKELSEPWFSLIKLGLKKCEGRLNKGDFKNIQVGDTINFYNDDFGIIRNIYVKITYKNYYNTFHDMLISEGLQECLPGIESCNQGMIVYRKYYSIRDEQMKGVVAIRFNLF